MYERLTRRDKKGVVYAPAGKPPSYVEFTGISADRFAAYEDSELSPEEVQELAKAKADGRMVELPCKVGAKLWFVVTKNKGRKSEHSFVKTGYFCESNFFSVLRKFGKTVFLTREAAEKALGGSDGSSKDE